jgi:1-acyl-sn-glycerol-3-phosphate acyltransferase
VEPIWWLGRFLLYPLRLLFVVRIDGKERVPRNGPVILASNHVSFLDPLLLLWLGERTRRKVRFLAMAELWRSRFMRFFLVHTKQIPVTRESSSAAHSLLHAARALGAGECVGIYPEGKISTDFEPLPGKTGAARLAALSEAPVIPVGVWGAHRVWPKGRKRKFRLGVALTIVVGEPVRVTEDDDLFDATDRVMGGIASCVATARRIYPQHPRRREGDWWVRAPETAVVRPTPRGSTNDRWA